MKAQIDEAVAEVRNARKALCDRFDNDPRRLLEHLREQQRSYRGQVVKDWSELEPPAAMRETPSERKGRAK